MKQWGDLEDNEHLIRIVEEMDTDSITFNYDLYNRLEQIYIDKLG